MYGLEKLYSEEMALAYGKDFGIKMRIARFHNIYGPFGTWRAGARRLPRLSAARPSLPPTTSR